MALSRHVMDRHSRRLLAGRSRRSRPLHVVRRELQQAIAAAASERGTIVHRDRGVEILAEVTKQTCATSGLACRA